VLSFINERMLHLTRNPKEDKIFTKTMINNYAKNKILPPPIKKKYTKDHMLLLLLIYYFKGVLSVSDTGELLGKITDKYFGEDAEFGLEEIYLGVFELEAHQIEVLRKDILEKFQIAEETFDEAPEESQEFLKTFTGMLKFAAHNNDGKVELIRCSSFLGKSVKIFEMLLALYEQVGFIKILDKNSAFYTIEFIGVDDISKILHTEKYTQIFELIIECEQFQKSLLEDDLTQIVL